MEWPIGACSDRLARTANRKSSNPCRVARPAIRERHLLRELRNCGRTRGPVLPGLRPRDRRRGNAAGISPAPRRSASRLCSGEADCADVRIAAAAHAEPDAATTATGAHGAAATCAGAADRVGGRHRAGRVADRPPRLHAGACRSSRRFTPGHSGASAVHVGYHGRRNATSGGDPRGRGEDRPALWQRQMRQRYRLPVAR